MQTSPFYIRKIFGELSMSTNSKFKAGDKVVKKYTSNGGSWDTHEYVTVDYVDGGQVHAVETGTWVDEGSIKHYEQPIEQKRKELVAAIRLCQSYDVQLWYGKQLSLDGIDHFLTITEILDKVLPPESPAQKKLKELEAQQRELANQMEKLRSEL